MKYKDLITTLIKTGQKFDLRLKEVAELTGYGLSVVGNWHGRHSRISLVQFIDWSNALGYDVTLIRKKAEDDPITNVRTRK